MWPAHSAQNTSLDLHAEDPFAPQTIRSVTKLAPGKLCLFSGQQGPTSNPEAWKRIIGDKPVSTRLQTLPESKPRWSALLTSTVFQVVVTGVLVVLPTLFPDQLAGKRIYDVVPVVAPETEIALPPEQPLVRPNVVAAPRPPEEPLQPPIAARLIAPKSPGALVPPNPKAAPVSAVDVPELNELPSEAKFEAPLTQPAKPREPVKTGTLEGGAAPTTPATIDKSVAQVQTGGFGDPNGLPGESSPSARANVAHAGFPALLPGTGSGNGTGGAKGARGTVASAGFGDGVAASGASGGGGSRKAIQAGGFESAVTSPDAPLPKQADAPPPVQPVVILSKPNPVYTEEARKLRLEGDVSVGVVFLASGSVRVVGVTNGLGHGLDEAAVHAAEQIHFKPALQDGKPVDFPATVHIEFQLAF